MNETILKKIIDTFGKENIVLMNWEPYGKMIFKGKSAGAYVIKDDIMYILSDAVNELSDLKLNNGVRLDAIHTSKVSMVTAMYKEEDKEKLKTLITTLGFTDDQIKTVFERTGNHVTFLDKTAVEKKKEITITELRAFTAKCVGEIDNKKLKITLPTEEILTSDEKDKVLYKPTFRLFSHLNNVEEIGELEVDTGKTTLTSKEELKHLIDPKFVNQKFYLEITYELKDGIIKKFGPYPSTSMVPHKN